MTYTLQAVAAVMLGFAGILQISRARREEDSLKAKNARTSGALLLLAGVIFAIVAMNIDHE